MENKELETKLDIRTSKDFIEWMIKEKSFSVGVEPLFEPYEIRDIYLFNDSRKELGIYITPSEKDSKYITELLTLADGVVVSTKRNNGTKYYVDYKPLIKEWKELNYENKN